MGIGKRTPRVATSDGEKRFRALAELAHCWYWEQDEHFRFTFVSPAAFSESGREIDQIVGKTRWELSQSPPDGPDWDAHKAALRNHKAFEDFRYSVRDAAGKPRQLSITGRPIFGRSGEFAGYQGVGVEITTQAEAERLANAQAERLRMAQLMARIISLEWDVPNDRISWSTSPEWLLGPLPPSGRYPPLKDMVHPQDRESFLVSRQAALDGVEEHHPDYRIVRTDGEVVWVTARSKSFRDAAGRPERMVVVIQDITKQREIELQLLEHRERLQIVHDLAGLYSVEWDIVNDKLHWSDSPEPILGKVPADTGRYPPYLEMIHPDDREQFLARRSATVAAIGRDAKEYRIIRTDGQVRWIMVREKVLADVNGKPTRMLIALQDISEQERLAYLAQFDAITGLPNRNLFRDRLSLAMSRSLRAGGKIGVMFLDLDHFKSVNDTLGHDVGDKLLKSVALRLKNCLREADTISRLGGDEFTVILEDIAERDYVSAIAQKILDVLANPFDLDSREVFCSASIGIAMYPDDGQAIDELLKQADMAMYRAKDDGRNAFRFFEPAMGREISARVTLETGLRHALERDELRLYYQPIIDLRSGEITAVEGLLRWEHPQLGVIEPERFIRTAEQTGLILPIGEWVMQRACEQCVDWQKKGIASLRVAVNLSAREFKGKDIEQAVKRVIQSTGLDPTCLQLEITEGTLMANPKSSDRVLRGIREMGSRVSVDDFGTGYSSLSYLKHFPLDLLKIDKSFVLDVTKNSDDAAIVKAIIVLATSLQLQLTAEGVETEAQRAFLRQHECGTAQGYLFSRPLPPSEIEKVLFAGPQFAAH